MDYQEQDIRTIELRPGQQVDRFRIQRPIGEGTFGIVTEVTDEFSGESFALKLLKLWSVPGHARKNLESRFRLEYETGRIESGFLVKSWHYGRWQGCPYLVMDYCPNGNLRQPIREGLPIEKATSLATDMLLGLQALHQHGKTHRDLKPENVLLDATDRARLTDFGIAGHLNARFTVLKSSGSPGEIFGSYNYMAPEQVKPVTRRDTLLPAIDIFAFGVVCFELFTGRLPFGEWALEEDMIPYLERAQRGQWDHLPSHNPAVPQAWVDIVEGCLAPDPQQRFRQVDEILERLGLAARYQTRTTDEDIGLLVLNGEEHGRTYRLADFPGPVLCLGRSTPGGNNHLDIKEHYSAYISRQHATLERHPDGWHLRDGQWQDRNGWAVSKNGTFVNGLEIGPAGRRLQPDDIVTIGNTTLKVIGF
ncbi:MAG: FHA domain-containing serine/threonine-protein kinase [Saprospiraceae bacterium]